VSTRPEDPPSEQRPLRETWQSGPDSKPAASSWRALDDDDLLNWVEELPPRHGHDRELIEIIQSPRHFFVRQEAAKRLEDASQLKQHFDDRHIGQILARRLSRIEDITYLEHLIRTSRHLEVRKAAEAQLRLVRGTATPPSKTPK
jgi:hypothetical protein